MNNRLLIILIAFLFGCNPTKEIKFDNQNVMVMQPIAHDLSMYPQATKNLIRNIISLPPKEDENNYKIEIYIGRIMEIDCNRHTLTGDFVEKDVSGWGYPYYNFETSGQTISTKMGCPESSIHKEFVKSKSKLIRYNSRLPVVVYVAKQYEVKYKIWSRDIVEHNATQK